jgi:mono/diheme cytochrome c family protein
VNGVRTLLIVVLLSVTCVPAAAGQEASDGAGAGAGGAEDALARGRYLVLITGCNDCHTERFSEAAGSLPESEWLTGSSLGFRGPWGTTYGTNLRRYVEGMTEDDWVAASKAMETRPPMPWWGMRGMSEADLRAMFVFIRSLGPVGEPEPAFVPPDQEPATPYVTFPMTGPP